MKSAVENQKLPNEVEALSFVCRCFGIGPRERDSTLKRMRKITPDAGKYFPKNAWRETVRRAKTGEDSWQNAIKIVCHEATYDRVRRQKGKPLWSFTGKLTDELVSILLSLYTRLLPDIKLQGVPAGIVLWILVENVFIPTVYVKLAQEWRYGLGNEFLDEVCWYLPIRSHGQIKKPLPRILDYWMQVSGFQTSYQVAKFAGKKSLRRKIDRWREGEIVPDALDLHKLVDRFAKKSFLAGRTGYMEGSFYVGLCHSKCLRFHGRVF